MALNPSFKPDGVITAGNSSGIVDGAAAVLVASERKVKELKLKPRARIVEQVIVGSEPVIMLTGPIPATQKALKRAGHEDRRHRPDRDQRGLRAGAAGDACRRSAWIPRR